MLGPGPRPPPAACASDDRARAGPSHRAPCSPVRPPEEVFRFFRGARPLRTRWQGRGGPSSTHDRAGIFRVWHGRHYRGERLNSSRCSHPHAACSPGRDRENDALVPPGSTTVELILEPDGDDTVSGLAPYRDCPTGPRPRCHEEWMDVLHRAGWRRRRAVGDPGTDARPTLIRLE